MQPHVRRVFRCSGLSGSSRNRRKPIRIGRTPKELRQLLQNLAFPDLLLAADQCGQMIAGDGIGRSHRLLCLPSPPCRKARPKWANAWPKWMPICPAQAEGCHLDGQAPITARARAIAGKDVRETCPAASRTRIPPRFRSQTGPHNRRAYPGETQAARAGRPCRMK